MPMHAYRPHTHSLPLYYKIRLYISIHSHTRAFLHSNFIICTTEAIHIYTHTYTHTCTHIYEVYEMSTRVQSQIAIRL